MTFSENIHKAAAVLDRGDAVLVGAGAGLSAAAGLDFSPKSGTFREHFGDFADKYGIQDTYTGGFYPFPTPEEYWAWWSRVVWLSRYVSDVGRPYRDLYEIVHNKDYFILTTNVDGQFRRAGFDMDRVFEVQGDFGLFQCSVPCTNKTYDNKEIIWEMYGRQKDMKTPSQLIPLCPYCGAPLIMNLRIDDTFVEDENWHRAAEAYESFVRSHRYTPKVLFEIGVGYNTPGIIKYAFWNMTNESPNAFCIIVNPMDVRFPQEIADRAVAIREDAGAALAQIRAAMAD